MSQNLIRPAALGLFLSFLVFGYGVTVLRGQSTAQAGPQQLFGTWRSLEKFENESRLSFAFKQEGNEIVGWAVMLGQQRKADNRATLGLTFHGATWNSDRLRFQTMLPEDEGTIGWEFRVTGPNSGVLTALTEDGRPIDDDDLHWDMTR